MPMNNKRNTNLDLLRIISMMMVVLGHFFTHGGVINGALVPWTDNWLLGNVIYTGCLVAVDCFVLLSGYFQCTSKFKLKRLVSVWVQVAFWSVMLYVIMAAVNGTFSVTALVKSGLVVTLKQYWFVTAYLLMYAVSPFLNCAIRAMSRKMHLMCCTVLLGLFSALHNVVYISDFANILGGSSFLWFCVLYVVAAYIRLHVPVQEKYRSRGFAVYAVCALLIALERFAAYYITPMIFGQVMLDSLFYANNSILNTAAAIALFMAMRAVKVERPGVPRMIGFFAPLAFGVYLIHDHPNVRAMLWPILKPHAFAHSVWMLPYALLCVSGIFTVCCLIEWLRRWLFRVCGINGLLDGLCDRVQNRVQIWLDADGH